MDIIANIYSLLGVYQDVCDVFKILFYYYNNIWGINQRKKKSKIKLGKNITLIITSPTLEIFGNACGTNNLNSLLIFVSKNF